MLTKRQLLTHVAACGGAITLPGCSGHATMVAYEEAVARTRAVLTRDADLRDVVRYATLAANGHNTQPWRFALSGATATILPDFGRRTPVVDPDDHHLFASLGCATENFVLAAQALGRSTAVAFDATGDGHMAIDLARGPRVENALFKAMAHRQCTRSVYDGTAVSAADLRRLEEAARLDGIAVMLVTDTTRREQLLDYVIAGNSRQMDDPAFQDELKAWIRFNPAAALATRDGLFSACAGNPTLPSWIAHLLFGFVFTKRAENEKYTKHLRSSAGVAVFVGAQNDKAHWVNAGRSYQRFALQATALGIRHAHVNQAVEVPEVRADFAAWLGMRDHRPNLVVRFGYAPPLPMSLRRPVEGVLV